MFSETVEPTRELHNATRASRRAASRPSRNTRAASGAPSAFMRATAHSPAAASSSTRNPKSRTTTEKLDLELSQLALENAPSVSYAAQSSDQAMPDVERLTLQRYINDACRHACADSNRASARLVQTKRSWRNWRKSNPTPNGVVQKLDTNDEMMLRHSVWIRNGEFDNHT